jgi:hypothetical protein
MFFLAKLCGTADDDCSLGLGGALPLAGNCPNDLVAGWLSPKSFLSAFFTTQSAFSNLPSGLS